MRSFAQFIHEELELPSNIADIRDICEGTDRYSMYKVGPVLSISVSISNMDEAGVSFITRILIDFNIM